MEGRELLDRLRRTESIAHRKINVIEPSFEKLRGRASLGECIWKHQAPRKQSSTDRLVRFNDPRLHPLKLKTVPLVSLPPIDGFTLESKIDR